MASSIAVASPVLSVLREALTNYRDGACRKCKDFGFRHQGNNLVLERMSVLYVILEPCVEEGDFARDLILLKNATTHQH